MHASAVPELILKDDCVDYVCIGEGEKTIQELAKALEERTTPESILGLAYRKNGQIFINPPRPLEKNIDNFRLDWEKIDVERYISVGKNGERVFRSYRASRGCPYDCAFCYNKYFNERKFRPHSIDYVMKDMKILKEKYNIDTVVFTDDYFFANKNRAFKLLNELKNIGITTINLDIRATDISDELIKKIVECEVKSIYIGTESENERVLKLIKKRITKEDIENASAICAKYPIEVYTQFILGIPTHTKEEILNSIRYGIELLKRYSNLYLTMVTYMPFPGTELYFKAIRDGYVPPDNIEEYDDFGLSFYLKPKFEMSWLRWATEKDLNKIKLVFPASVCMVLMKPRLNDSLITRVIKKPLFAFLCWRLSRLNFKLFIELYVIRLLMKRPKLADFLKKAFTSKNLKNR